MAEQISKSKIDNLEAELGTLKATAKKGISQLDVLMSKLKKTPKGPPIKKRGWLGKAKNLGAPVPVLKLLEQAESTETRESCVAALNAVQKENALAPIAKEIRDLLKADEAVAKHIDAFAANVKKHVDFANRLEGSMSKDTALVKTLLDDFTKIETNVSRMKK